MQLTPQALKTITKYIYARFPEISGSKPQVKQRPVPKTKTNLPNETYLITYEKLAHSGQGIVIPRSVRVIVNHKGEIIRVSTSR